MNVSHDDIVCYGFVITALFDELYPTGTTVEQMELDADSNGWIRAILNSLVATKTYEEGFNWSEDGL